MGTTRAEARQNLLSKDSNLRINSRGYTLKKIQENNEAEIMQVVLEEARESYPAEIVVELQSEKTEDLSLVIKIRKKNQQREKMKECESLQTRKRDVEPGICMFILRSRAGIRSRGGDDAPCRKKKSRSFFGRSRNNVRRKRL